MSFVLWLRFVSNRATTFLRQKKQNLQTWQARTWSLASKTSWWRWMARKSRCKQSTVRSLTCSIHWPLRDVHNRKCSLLSSGYMDKVHRPGNRLVFVHVIELPEPKLNEARESTFFSSYYDFTSLLRHGCIGKYFACSLLISFQEAFTCLPVFWRRCGRRKRSEWRISSRRWRRCWRRSRSVVCLPHSVNTAACSLRFPASTSRSKAFCGRRRASREKWFAASRSRKRRRWSAWEREAWVACVAPSWAASVTSSSTTHTAPSSSAEPGSPVRLNPCTMRYSFLQYIKPCWLHGFVVFYC